MTRIAFPYLMSDLDRHGNERLYVRRHGRKIRIREKLGTAAFARSYADALQVLDRGLARPLSSGGSTQSPSRRDAGSSRSACGNRASPARPT